MELGRGHFSRVVRQADFAVKIIDFEDQRPPHNYKIELECLKQLGATYSDIISLVSETFQNGIEPELRLTMPFYEATLDHVIFNNAKAKFPPGSGWRNAMPMQRLCLLGARIATALAHVHAHGILHRDLKPENILLPSVDSDEIVLIDFGISWTPDLGETPKVCDVATQDYRAPELLLGITDYTEAIDLWALGCVLAKMAGTDVKAPFAPYTSDMGLLAAQYEALGSPDLAECPSLAQHKDSIPHVPGHGLQLRPHSPEIILELLNYEWTSRPSAKDVAAALTSQPA